MARAQKLNEWRIARETVRAARAAPTPPRAHRQLMLRLPLCLPVPPAAAQVRAEMEAELAGDLSKEQEEALLASLQEKEDTAARLLGERRVREERAAFLQDAYGRIKQSTGVSSLDTMVERFLGQRANRAALERERDEAVERLAAARQAHDHAVAEYNEQKTTGGAVALPPRPALESGEAAAAEGGEEGPRLADVDVLKVERAAIDKAAAATRLRLKAAKGSGDRLEDILVSVRAGAASLGGLLDTFREFVGMGGAAGAGSADAAPDAAGPLSHAAAAAAASAAFAAAAAAAAEEMGSDRMSESARPGSPLRATSSVSRRPVSASTRQALDVRRHGGDVLRLLGRCDGQLATLTDALGRAVVEQMRVALASLQQAQQEAAAAEEPPAPPPSASDSAFFLTSVAEQPPAATARRPLPAPVPSATDTELLAALDELVRTQQPGSSSASGGAAAGGGMGAGASPTATSVGSPDARPWNTPKDGPPALSLDVADVVEALAAACAREDGPAGARALRTLSAATTRMLLADVVRAEAVARGQLRPGGAYADPREALLRMEAPAQLPGAENDLTLAAVTLGGAAAWGGGDAAAGTPQQFLPTTPARNVRVDPRHDHARALAASLQPAPDTGSLMLPPGSDGFALPPPAGAAASGAGLPPSSAAAGAKRIAGMAAAAAEGGSSSSAAALASASSALLSSTLPPQPMQPGPGDPSSSSASFSSSSLGAGAPGGGDDDDDAVSISREALRHSRPSAALLVRTMRASMAAAASSSAASPTSAGAEAAALAALLPSSLDAPPPPLSSPGGGGMGGGADDRGGGGGSSSPPASSSVGGGGAAQSAPLASAASGGGGLTGARRLRQSARESSAAAAAATVAAASASAGDSGARAAAAALASAAAGSGVADEGVVDRAALKRRAAEVAQEEWRRRDGASRAAAAANSASSAAARAVAAAAAGIGSPDSRRGSPLRGGGLGGGGGAPEPTGLGYLIQRPKLN